ncbi:ExbD/TolR family protein [Botrimarina hoheduenensis]|uniref:Biopolymer transport protein ExbD/TolR n=1 Tax=Botrimarina hoheduenensis TaxID=2528000 RepID=A0A5C5VVG5_9BACT|nr:biopolymer transporter ExbD [Botrimarina hoheduenensis]TWT42568.1 Biopolymer transport protein ExbD/TolR [Botrimarina hoheduenensis]
MQSGSPNNEAIETPDVVAAALPILRVRARGGEDDELDMTPMVDVTFLLLIFFMITAAFALQKAIEVPPASQDQSASVQTVEELEADSIVVRVDSDNIYWVGCPAWTEEKRSPSKQSMRTRVREARAAPGAVEAFNRLLVQASGDATHEFVVAALDAGSSSGVEQIRVMLFEDADE